MATGYWDGANNGLWSAVANWNTTLSGAVNVTVVPGVADVAHFNNNAVVTVRDIYLNGSRSVGQIAFNSNNRGTTLKGGTSVTPAANTLTLGSSGINASGDSAYFFVTDANTTVALTSAATPFTIPSTNASYVSGPMTGTGFGINKQSGGHLVFNGAGKIYTGETRVSGGVLFLFTTLSTPSAGTTALTVDSGATVSCNTTNVYGTATNNYLWNIAGSVNSDSGYQWLPIGATLTNGTLGGSSASALGAFHVASGRTSTITGYGTISGSVGLIGGLTTSVTTGQTLTVSGAIGTASANTGSLTNSGVGTLTLTGANTYTGGSTLNAGTVNLGVAQVSTTSGPLGASGTITLDGGTLQYSAANQHDYSPRFSTAASQQYRCDTNGQSVAWASNLTSSGGTLVKSGTGTLTVSGTNTYSGGATLSAGGLTLGSDSALGTGTFTISGGTVDVSGARSITNAMSIGASFTFTGSSTLAQSTGSVTLTTSPTITVSASTLTLGGAIGGAFGLTKAGAASLVLTGVNTYSGTTTINVGQLTLGGAGQLGSGSYSQSISNSGALTIFTSATQTLSGNISGAGILNHIGSNTLTLAAVAGAGGDRTNTNSIQGSGALALTAPSGRFYELSGDTTTFTGSVSVTGLISCRDSARGSFLAAFTQNAGSILLTGQDTGAVDSTFHMGSLSGSGTLTGAGYVGSNTGTKTISIGVLGADTTFSGTIVNQVGGAGSVVAVAKTGAGKQTLASANTYTGGTVIDNGTLAAGNTSALGAGVVNMVFPATLQALASINGKLNIGGTLTNSGGTLRIGGS